MMSRLTRCGLAAMLLTANPAAAQSPSNSQPAYIADERVLVGRYHYEETSDDFKIDVELNADNTALYRITTGERNEDFIKAVGFWTFVNPIIHIHNKPGPVRLEPSGVPTRDPSVGLAIVATNADGSPADGLDVTWAGSDELFSMSNGRHRSEPGELKSGTTVSVVRAADRKILRRFPLTPSGPNSFRFTYYPSDVEPFDFTAFVLDAHAEILEVEVGTSQAQLTRVTDKPIKR